MTDKVTHKSHDSKVTPSGRSHQQTQHKGQKSRDAEGKGDRSALHKSQLSLLHNFGHQSLPRIYQCLWVISYQKIPGSGWCEQICTFWKMAKSQPEVQLEWPNSVHTLYWGRRVQIWSQILLPVKPEIVDFLTSGGNISKLLGENRFFVKVKKLFTIKILQNFS